MEKLISKGLLWREMAGEQYIIQLAQLEQEANRFQEQMQMLDAQIEEIQSIQQSLKEIENSKENTIYSNLGKNIFVKTEIIGKNLLVDVGNKTFVKKDIPGTLKVIEEQIEKIARAKGQIVERLGEIQEQMQKIVEEAEKENKN
jgi:prefoldin alpha subunit